MKAKKKPIEIIASESLGIDFKPRNIVIKVEDPPVRKAGIIVDNVDTLIDKLKNEAKVI
jgi:electron transfer flavoprotein beta subunit